jgi:hypothetical protein
MFRFLILLIFTFSFAGHTICEDERALLKSQQDEETNKSMDNLFDELDKYLGADESHSKTNNLFNDRWEEILEDKNFTLNQLIRDEINRCSKEYFDIGYHINRVSDIILNPIQIYHQCREMKPTDIRDYIQDITDQNINYYGQTEAAETTVDFLFDENIITTPHFFQSELVTNIVSNLKEEIIESSATKSWAAGYITAVGLKKELTTLNRKLNSFYDILAQVEATQNSLFNSAGNQTMLVNNLQNIVERNGYTSFTADEFAKLKSTSPEIVKETSEKMLKKLSRFSNQQFINNMEYGLKEVAQISFWTNDNVNKLTISLETLKSQASHINMAPKDVENLLGGHSKIINFFKSSVDIPSFKKALKRNRLMSGSATLAKQALLQKFSMNFVRNQIKSFNPKIFLKNMFRLSNLIDPLLFLELKGDTPRRQDIYLSIEDGFYIIDAVNVRKNPSLGHMETPQDFFNYIDSHSFCLDLINEDHSAVDTLILVNKYLANNSGLYSGTDSFQDDLNRQTISEQFLNYMKNALNPIVKMHAEIYFHNRIEKFKEDNQASKRFNPVSIDDFKKDLFEECGYQN